MGALTLKRRRRRQLFLVGAAALFMLGACAFLHQVLSEHHSQQHHRTTERGVPRFDAIVIPGGGLFEDKPLAWVTARLDAALLHAEETRYFLVLSRGTTHKPPPLDARGFPVDESAASARYLVEHGIAPSRVLLESWSLDTIGNAAFSRLMHAEPRAWRELLVITSSIHLPRTRAIFDWVFSLPPLHTLAPHIAYESVVEQGLSAEQHASRDAKEQQALEHLKAITERVRDLAELHSFLFVEHAAYAAPKQAATSTVATSIRAADESLMATY